MTNYQKYQNEMISKINNCIEAMECLPILFIGTGLSKRYFNAPNWEQLLEQLSNNNPKCKKFAYYKQNFSENSVIGSELKKEYSEWAWEDGNDHFDKSLYNSNFKSDIFVKNEIKEIIDKITPKGVDEIHEKHAKEISLLQEIRPHAIITTNYDKFLEVIFPEYIPIIGQQILRTQYQSIGEIFKIHGCISQYSDIVLTEQDYENFNERKKYLSAKLLTYFLEHPIFIFGYSVSDENIKALLSDIDEILASKGELVQNIFIVDWEKSIDQTKNYAFEELLNLNNGKSIRINKIVANEFDWIFKSLSIDTPIENVNPKLLRALLSRTYELVRTDIPRRTIEIDYQTLITALSDKKEIGKIFGITKLFNAEAFNLSFPYSLTDVGKKLGYTNWYGANKLLDQIKIEKGICIKDNDNKYHIAIPTGKSHVRKYSDELISLLIKVRDNEEYSLEL